MLCFHGTIFPGVPTIFQATNVYQGCAVTINSPPPCTAHHHVDPPIEVTPSLFPGYLPTEVVQGNPSVPSS